MSAKDSNAQAGERTKYATWTNVSGDDDECVLVSRVPDTLWLGVSLGGQLKFDCLGGMNQGQ